MDTLIGPIKPASYIVIDDIKSDSWGFQGSTQEFRFAQNKG
jgi:4-oxalocrotonate tautomerase